MGYEPEPGRPLRNFVFYLTHPLRMAREKPILFLGSIAPAVYFLGVWQGWWPNFLIDIINRS